MLAQVSGGVVHKVRFAQEVALLPNKSKKGQSRVAAKMDATDVVICVRNEGYELDLKPMDFYEVVPDESLEPDDIRVIDETGEDYIYPASYFVSASQIEHGRPAL